MRNSELWAIRARICFEFRKNDFFKFITFKLLLTLSSSIKLFC